MPPSPEVATGFMGTGKGSKIAFEVLLILASIWLSTFTRLGSLLVLALTVTFIVAEVGWHKWRFSEPRRLVTLLVGSALFWAAVIKTNLSIWPVIQSARPISQQPSAAPPTKLNPNKVTQLIAVSAVHGQDLDGQIIIRNDTSQAVTLLAYRYNAFGGHINDHAGPETIPAYGTYPIVIEELNKLMKSARLDLRYDFKFDGDDTLHKAQASFVIPDNPSNGDQIGPRACCKADDAPELNDQAASLEETLREPQGNVGFEVKDENGHQSVGELPFQMVRFDPVGRYVMFLSGPANNQVVLVSGINRVPTGEHWIQAMWNVKKKQYWMAADGHPAKRLTKAEVDAAIREQPTL